MLISADSCAGAFPECKTSNADSICESCKANNASPAMYSCECDEGYYGSHPLLQSNSCVACDSQCRTCQEALLCTECKDTNARPSTTQGCYCVDGYYMNSTSTLCTACPPDCLTCKDSLNCIVCKSTFATPNTLGGCDCPTNSTLVDLVCTCPTTYYMEYSTVISGYECNQCVFPCIACTSQVKCSTCTGELLVNDAGLCIDCPQGTYYSNYSCDQCASLCMDCSSADTCNSCVGNATGPNQCACDPGFQIFHNTCAVQYFYGSVRLLSSTKISLQFTEPLQVPLTATDLSIVISKAFTFAVVESSDLEYLIELSFSESIAQNTPATVKIQREVVLSTLGAQLKDYVYTVALDAYSITKISSVIGGVVNSTTTIAKATVFGSLCSAIISNPATTWVLINNIQVVSYIPISDNPLTPTLNNCFQSFGSMHLIPSISKVFFSPSNDTGPYTQAGNYGFSTDIFLYNAGSYILTFLGALLSWPLVYLFSKCRLGGISTKFQKVLISYRYSFFIRFWIQGYLDLAFFVTIQMRTGSCHEVTPDTWIRCSSLGISALVVVCFM